MSFARFPQLIGVLTLSWALRGWMTPTPGWAGVEFFLVATALLTVAGVWLMGGRHVPVGAGLLMVGGAIELWARPELSNSALVLMMWAALIVMVTEGRANERALLLRVCVTCVYAFTGLAKLNPSFLAGDAIYRVTATRPQWAWAMEAADGPLGRWLAWSTVAVELWLAVGLWLPRTRRPTAILGVVVHTLLIPVAAVTVGGAVFLAVLNLGLVAMYPAFWHPVHARERHDARASGSLGDSR